MLRTVAPALVVLLARSFDKPTFGLYLSLQLWTLTLTRLFVLGLDKGLAWYIPENRRDGRSSSEGLASSLFVTAAFGLAGLILLSAALLLGLLDRAEAFGHHSRLFVLLLLWSTPFQVVQNIGAGAAEGARSPQYRILINQFLSVGLAPVFALALLAMGGGELSLAAGLFCAHVLGAIAYVPVLWHLFPRMLADAFRKVPPRLMAYSLPLGLSELVVSVLLRIDLWMVLLLLGPERAAVYGILVTVANAVRTVRQSFDPMIVPIVSGMPRNRLPQDLPELFSYTVRMVTTLQALVVFFLLLFPKEVLSLAGSGYQGDIAPLGILLLSNLLNGYFGMPGMVALGLGHSRQVVLANLLSLALGLGLNALLIPRFGLSGGAMASLSSTLFQNLWMVVFVRRRESLRLYRPQALRSLAFVVLFFVGQLFQERLLTCSILQRAGAYAFMLLWISIQGLPVGNWIRKIRSRIST